MGGDFFFKKRESPIVSRLLNVSQHTHFTYVNGSTMLRVNILLISFRITLGQRHSHQHIIAPQHSSPTPTLVPSQHRHRSSLHLFSL